jgi:hypothetical protein
VSEVPVPASNSSIFPITATRPDHAAAPCIGCGIPTDTGLAVWGDTDWCYDVIHTVALREDAEDAMLEAVDLDFGREIDQVRMMGIGVRVCRECALCRHLLVIPIGLSDRMAVYAQPGAPLPWGWVA